MSISATNEKSITTPFGISTNRTSSNVIDIAYSSVCMYACIILLLNPHNVEGAGADLRGGRGGRPPPPSSGRGQPPTPSWKGERKREEREKEKEGRGRKGVKR